MAKNVTPVISLLIFAKELLMKSKLILIAAALGPLSEGLQSSLGTFHLWGMFAPVIKYAGAELCWQRWAPLSPDEREPPSLARREREAASIWGLPPALRCRSLSGAAGGPCAVAYLSITPFSFGTFSVSRSHFIPFLVKTESIFPSLPVRRRFSQPPQQHSVRERQTDRRSFGELVMTSCHLHRSDFKKSPHILPMCVWETCFFPRLLVPHFSPTQDIN